MLVWLLFACAAATVHRAVYDVCDGAARHCILWGDAEGPSDVMSVVRPGWVVYVDPCGGSDCTGSDCRRVPVDVPPSCTSGHTIVMHTPIEIRWPNVTVTSLYADRRRPLLVPEAPRTLDIADGQLPCAVIIIRAPAAVVAGFDFDIGTCVNTVVQIFVLQGHPISDIWRYATPVVNVDAAPLDSAYLNLALLNGGDAVLRYLPPDATADLSVGHTLIANVQGRHNESAPIADVAVFIGGVLRGTLSSNVLVVAAGGDGGPNIHILGGWIGVTAITPVSQRAPPCPDVHDEDRRHCAAIFAAMVTVVVLVVVSLLVAAAYVVYKDLPERITNSEHNKDL